MLHQKNFRLSGDVSYNGGRTWKYVMTFSPVSCELVEKGVWKLGFKFEVKKDEYKVIKAIFDSDDIDKYFKGRSYVKTYMNDLINSLSDYKMRCSDRYQTDELLLR